MNKQKKTTKHNDETIWDLPRSIFNSPTTVFNFIIVFGIAAATWAIIVFIASTVVICIHLKCFKCQIRRKLVPFCNFYNWELNIISHKREFFLSLLTYFSFTEDVPLVAALGVVLLLPGFDDIIEDDCGDYIVTKSNLIFIALIIELNRSKIYRLCFCSLLSLLQSVTYNHRKVSQNHKGFSFFPNLINLNHTVCCTLYTFSTFVCSDF